MSRTIICETERLILRLPTLDDAEASFAIYSDPETVKYIDSDNLPFTSVDQASKSIERGLAHYEQHSVCHFAVELKESGAMIGHCGFNTWEDNINLELVVHLSRAYWGKGYASEACKAVIEFARTEFPDRITYAIIDDKNQFSIALIKTLKFKVIEEESGYKTYKVQ